MNNTSAFYNDISGNYDEMFDFEKDLASAEAVVTELKKQLNFEKALDIGCGTGSYTIALAQSGLKATGMDLSSSMLDVAKKNSIAFELDIDFVNSGMTEMQSDIDQKFDLIMCMGNTLPHLLSQEDLSSMMAACRQLLNPGGHLVLNLLNYDRILAKKERIIGISRSENHEFIRFNDFEPPYVNFNLLEINWDKKIPEHKILSTKLYPYTHLEIESALMKADFKISKIYGNLKFDKYSPETSRAILIVAQF